MDVQYAESQKTVYTLERKRKHQSFEFSPLENEDSTETNRRYVLYRNSILAQSTVSTRIKADINNNNLVEFTSLIKRKNHEDRMDTLVLLPDSSISSATHFLKQVNQHMKSPLIKTVFLNSREHTTMRALLRAIVRDVITDENLEDDLDFDRRLPFDLDLVEDWCKLQKNQEDVRIVLIFKDVDSLNTEMLNKLLGMLTSFKDRFQIKLVFNVEVNLKTLLLKLNHDVLSSIRIHKFHIEQTDLILNKVFDECMLSSDLQISHELSDYILETFDRNSKNVDEFLRILKYSKMCFFFGNFLSVIHDHISDKEYVLDGQYGFAIRTLPSFKRFINSLIQSDQKHLIRSYLYEDKELTSLVRSSFKIYKQSYSNFLSVYKLITQILNPLLPTSQNHVDIYNKLSSPDEFERFQFINQYISMLTASLKSSDQIQNCLSLLANISESDDYLQRLNMNLKTLDFNPLTNLQKMENKEELIGLHYEIELRKLKESFLELVEKFLKNSIRSNEAVESWYYKQEPNFETEIPVYCWQTGLFNELWLLNDRKTVEQNLVPDYRNSLIDALINHEKYLPYSDINVSSPPTEDDKGEEVEPELKTPEELLNNLNALIDPLLPTLYQISRETTLLINIFDYYTAFKNSLQYHKVIKLLKQLVESEEWENYLKDDERFGFIYSIFNSNDNGKQSESELWDLVSLAWFYQKCQELILMGFLIGSGHKKRRDVLEKCVWKDL